MTFAVVFAREGVMIQKVILALVMVAIAAVPCAMTFAFRGRRGEERPRCRENDSIVGRDDGKIPSRADRPG
jgi:hypothetical protein